MNNKHVGTVMGVMTTTNMPFSDEKDNIYNIDTNLCKTCYDIFGIRTSEQCKKCKGHATNINIDEHAVQDYRNGIRKHYTKKKLKEMKKRYYVLMQKRIDSILNNQCIFTDNEDKESDNLVQILSENDVDF